MKYLKVLSQLSYTDKDGKEKKRYFPTGVIKITPTGMMYLRLFQQPSVEYLVFEQKDATEEELPVINVDEE